MSIPTDAAEGTSRRSFKAPYSSRHPVPNVRDYEETLQDRQNHTTHEYPKDDDSGSVNTVLDVIGAAMDHLLRRGDNPDHHPPGQQLCSSQSHNIEATNRDGRGQISSSRARSYEVAPQSPHENQSNVTDSDNLPNDDIRGRRRHSALSPQQGQQGCEVTDPVTHLPIVVNDWTSAQLGSMREKQVPASCARRNEDGHHGIPKAEQQQITHRRKKLLFLPPRMDTTGQELSSILRTALTAGLIILLGTSSLLLVASHWYLTRVRLHREAEQRCGWTYWSLFLIIWLFTHGLLGILLVTGMRFWVEKKTLATWEDVVWDAARTRDEGDSESSVPESVQWLNSFLTSVWPLVNPDLFKGLADTLEDVMQASVPKFVRMISVDDLGQGSEAIRILGIKWLPPGNAQKDVSANGDVQEGGEATENNSGTPKNREKAKNDNGTNPNGGHEAEEGDFVNVEMGFSYRASKIGKSMRVKAKNAHLYLVFYLPGGIQLPVWVELRGMVGSMRMRLRLCPDPPFIALCTLTLLGQPKAELSCVPLTRKGLNIMDLPFISSFVQNSIDAALAEYVAPKSLSLDLKGMLIGDDFKKNTSAHGVLFVRIISATGFKEGDRGITGLGRSTSDGYVSVGWAKLGKPLWSTRIIRNEMEPSWQETAFLLVGPNEFNAGERLRVQLWDSDRNSADDDLGRVEVDLKELTSDPSSFAQISDRSDELRALSPNEGMPGLLSWRVGYFPKSRIQQAQVQQQPLEPNVKSIQQLKDAVAQDVYRKMREASSQNGSPAFGQQMAQDLKSREDSMIAATAPPQDFPMGILSLQIHQISGLEYERVNKSRDDDDTADDLVADYDDLPSSYCTIILNHQKIFKTRTKSKSSEPFFNAATERFIRNWRNAEVLISVRDAKVHENDPLLGLVYLPLHHVLKDRSQVIDTYPIVGGVGYGRARISLMFRPVGLHLPPSSLGWDYGTLEVLNCKSPLDKILPVFHDLHLKARTSVSRGKMYKDETCTEEVCWRGKKGRTLRLAVQQRYRSCLVIEFRKYRLGMNATPAFAVLWLQDIVDEEENTIRLPIFSGSKANLKRAESNYTYNLKEQLGTIAVTVQFRRGLGPYHQRLASKNNAIQDVWEVLNTAMDNKEINNAMIEDMDTAEDSSSSESSDDEGNTDSTGGLRKQVKTAFKNKAPFGNGGNEDSGATPFKQLQEYNDHSDQLHRHHRGLMQWKGARTAKWMKSKVADSTAQVTDSLKHHNRDPDIEKEV